ncbi:MAG: DUF1501 domain-containing protein, partial [Planctomycetota bacterium]|nr:DUF1501 domain-containing protein [Planctomycetota bacterium]
PPHFEGKAKNCIFLFMYGGPSQMETFDPKPKLYELAGQTVRNFKTHGRGGHRDGGRIVGPNWKFKQYGQSGQWVSDLFPHLATCVDDIAFIKSMTAISPIHGSALLQMNSGEIISGSPSLGSWVNYGLGSVSENLPGFVVMCDPRGGPISGAKNWSSGYMPAVYQATMMRPQGNPILNLKRFGSLTSKQQQHMLATLREYNERHHRESPDNSELAARMSSYELAFRMQSHAPDAVDINQESEKTKELYGIDNERTAEFGRRCLIARRLIERGVRFIQLYSGGGHNDDNWDAHTDMVKNHGLHAGETDKPIAGLLKDLKRRGMLEETIVVWGGEFGRQPTAEYAKGTGRDHNAKGFTMWAAGGGIKGGISVGETDELGNEAQGTLGEDKFQVKHLHATILHQMGLSPNNLSYFYGGLDRRLVGVEGAEIIHKIV